jgi:MFS transporter, DHA1 family, inner membrane transport protein
LRRAPRSLLAALLAVRLFDEAGQFVLPGTAEQLRDDLGLTYTQVSSAFVALAVGGLAGAPATVAADRRSRRVVCAGGAALAAVSLALIACSTTYATFALGCFLGGVASTAMIDGAEIALADVAGDRLEHHLTTQNVLASVGDLVGPAVVVTVLAVGGSWRWCFAVSALLCGAYAVWLATLRFPPPVAVDGEDGVVSVLRSVLADPLVWLLGVVAALLNPLDDPLVAFFIPHLVDARGVAPVAATVVASMSVAGGFAGYGSLRRWPARVGVDAPALAMAVTASVVAMDAITASIASAAIGVFIVRVWIDVQRRMLTIRPGRAGAVKAMIGVIETGGLVLPLVAGVVADAAGVTAGLASFAVMAWILAAAGAAIHRRTSGRSPRR